jgi:hypothetical protein
MSRPVTLAIGIGDIVRVTKPGFEEHGAIGTVVNVAQAMPGMDTWRREFCVDVEIQKAHGAGTYPDTCAFSPGQLTTPTSPQECQ